MRIPPCRGVEGRGPLAGIGTFPETLSGAKAVPRRCEVVRCSCTLVRERERRGKEGEGKERGEGEREGKLGKVECNVVCDSVV